MAKSPTYDERKRAGVVDVSDFGERDIANAYPDGTIFDLGDGTYVDPNRVPNILRDGPPKQRPGADKNR